jgi:hypothetical protein
VKSPFVHSNIYTAQRIGNDPIILHHDAAEDNVLTLEALIGKNVEITSDNERIGSIIDTQSQFKQLERSRGWRR